MARVYLGLGSNMRPLQHLSNALEALQQRFGRLDVSPVYESEPVGFSGANFLNLVVGLDTDLPVPDLRRMLRSIEEDNGRKRTAADGLGRSLDIDILTVDQLQGSFGNVTLPRREILYHAFVLRPFADLAPDYLHPERKCTLAELWAAFDAGQQKLWPVDFTWSIPDAPAHV